MKDQLQAKVRSVDAESEVRVWVWGGRQGLVGLALSPGCVGSTEQLSKAAVGISTSSALRVTKAQVIFLQMSPCTGVGAVGKLLIDLGVIQFQILSLLGLGKISFFLTPNSNVF